MYLENSEIIELVKSYCSDACSIYDEEFWNKLLFCRFDMYRHESSQPRGQSRINFEPLEGNLLNALLDLCPRQLRSGLRISINSIMDGLGYRGYENSGRRVIMRKENNRKKKQKEEIFKRKETETIENKLKDAIRHGAFPFRLSSISPSKRVHKEYCIHIPYEYRFDRNVFDVLLSVTEPSVQCKDITASLSRNTVSNCLITSN